MGPIYAPAIESGPPRSRDTPHPCYLARAPEKNYNVKMGGLMEDKLDATHRLRIEGRWLEASAFKEQRRRALRAEGVPRIEAKNRAWQEMLSMYPPRDQEGARPSDDVDADSLGTVFDRLRDDEASVPLSDIAPAVDSEFIVGCGRYIGAMIDRWARTHGIVISPQAAEVLKCKLLGLLLANGAREAAEREGEYPESDPDPS
jgi:hypothetical protein